MKISLPAEALPNSFFSAEDGAESEYYIANSFQQSLVFKVGSLSVIQSLYEQESHFISFSLAISCSFDSDCLGTTPQLFGRVHEKLK